MRIPTTNDPHDHVATSSVYSNDVRRWFPRQPASGRIRSAPGIVKIL